MGKSRPQMHNDIYDATPDGSYQRPAPRYDVGCNVVNGALHGRIITGMYVRDADDAMDVVLRMNVILRRNRYPAWVYYVDTGAWQKMWWHEDDIISKAEYERRNPKCVIHHEPEKIYPQPTLKMWRDKYYDSRIIEAGKYYGDADSVYLSTLHSCVTLSVEDTESLIAHLQDICGYIKQEEHRKKINAYHNCINKMGYDNEERN